jgi:hypothetical protein
MNNGIIIDMNIISRKKLKHLREHLDEYFINGGVAYFEDIDVPDQKKSEPLQIVYNPNRAAHPAIRDKDRIFEIIYAQTDRVFLLKVINALVRYYAARMQEDVNNAATEFDPPQNWKRVWDTAVDWQSRNDCLDFDLEVELCGDSEVLTFSADKKSITFHGRKYSIAPMQHQMLKFLYDEDVISTETAVKTLRIKEELKYKPSFKVPNTMKNSRADAKALYGTLLKWHKVGKDHFYYLDLSK